MLWTSAVGLLGILATGAAGEIASQATNRSGPAGGSHSVFEVARVRMPPLRLKGSEPSSSTGQTPRHRLRLDQRRGRLILRTADSGVECTMLILLADPSIDFDFAKPVQRDVDPGISRPSGCRSSEVRRLSPGAQDGRTTR